MNNTHLSKFYRHWFLNADSFHFYNPVFGQTLSYVWWMNCGYYRTHVIHDTLWTARYHHVCWCCAQTTIWRRLKFAVTQFPLPPLSTIFLLCLRSEGIPDHNVGGRGFVSLILLPSCPFYHLIASPVLSYTSLSPFSALSPPPPPPHPLPPRQ